MERDHLSTLQDLVGAAAAGQGVQRAAVLAELQRVSAWALRDVVSQVRAGGTSWRELADDLGVATTTLHGQYRSGRGVVLTGHTNPILDAAPAVHIGPPAARRPAPGTEQPVGCLPTAGLDQYVGRDKELAELRAQVARSRVVTVAGPAGVGKTRLLTEFVHHNRRSYPGGMWWVPLAPLAPGSDIDGAVITALTDGAPASAEEAVAAVHGRGTGLLVLDNCEHLVDVSAGLVARLLAACPRLRVLTSSREALRIPGETLFPLRPFATTCSMSDPGPADLRALPALRLFTDRARAVQPSFELTDELAPIVAELCRRLDGLPLAIELAARQIGVLTPAQLLDRVDSRLTLLTGGHRDGPPHHQSLRAAVDWSYRLLTPDEQVAFRHLALLPGGFDEDAAAALTGGSWATLTALAGKNVIVADGSPGRFRMLESLRVFGRERLESAGEMDAAHDRLLGWLTEVTRHRETDLLTSAEVLARQEHELDNLRYAEQVAQSTGDERHPALALALATAYRHGGDLLHAQGLLTRLLTRGPSVGALVPIELAIVMLERGDYAAAQRYAERGRLQASDEGLRAWENRALAVLAQAHHCLGDEPTALSLKQQLVANLRTTERPFDLARALGTLAWQLVTTDRLQPAAEAIEEALTLLDADHHAGRTDPAASAMLHTAGTIAFLRDRFDAAREHFHLALNTNAVEPHELPANLDGAALVAARTGEPERALRLFAAAGAMRDERAVTAEPWWARLRDGVLGAVQDRTPPARAAELRAEGESLDACAARTYAIAGVLPPPAELQEEALSPRELQVAELVAAGMSNPQIALRLHISARTVASHLEKIRTRLDLPTRAHITAWVTNRRSNQERRPA